MKERSVSECIMFIIVYLVKLTFFLVTNDVYEKRNVISGKVILIILVTFFAIGEGVVVAKTIESTGPGGYGWQQAYGGTGPSIARLTASADRDTYDYGYKNIQVYVRFEDYWSQDCGWWYVTGGKQLTVELRNDTTIFNTTTITTSLSSKGGGSITYSWSDLGTYTPGRWNVSVYDNENFSSTDPVTFYIYVRGQLNITSISTSGNTVGSEINITANVKDHSGRLIKGDTPNAPVVKAYVTGSGEEFEIVMNDDGTYPDVTAYDGEWTGSFTPQKAGDHKIIVVAGDDHQYWIDGRGSTTVVISGTFPLSFAFSSKVRMLIIVLVAIIIVTGIRRSRDEAG
jgi:hypothetical protein